MFWVIFYPLLFFPSMKFKFIGVMKKFPIFTWVGLFVGCYLQFQIMQLDKIFILDIFYPDVALEK